MSTDSHERPTFAIRTATPTETRLRHAEWHQAILAQFVAQWSSVITPTATRLWLHLLAHASVTREVDCGSLETIAADISQTRVATLSTARNELAKHGLIVVHKGGRKASRYELPGCLPTYAKPQLWTPRLAVHYKTGPSRVAVQRKSGTAPPHVDTPADTGQSYAQA